MVVSSLVYYDYYLSGRIKKELEHLVTTHGSISALNEELRQR